MTQDFATRDPDADTEALLAGLSSTADSVGAPASIWARLLANRDLVLLVIAALVFIFFALATPTFLTKFNLLNTIRNISLISIVAVGMTFVLVAGEIDLSVGSVYGVLTVAMGLLVVQAGLDPWLAMPAVIVGGLAIGATTGLIVVRVGIPSFIVTLAMLAAYRSLALIISSERPLTVRGRDLFYQVTGGDLMGQVPWLILWMLAVVLIGGIVLAWTRFGYHVYATGGNAEAARGSGIAVGRVKLLAFMLTGALCGLAAALVFGYLRVAGPTTGTGFEFRVIGAVVVGGVALTGGRGTILGTVLGGLIIGMITSGMVLLGFSQNVGDVATGLLIILVGSLDLAMRRRLKRRLG